MKILILLSSAILGFLCAAESSCNDSRPIPTIVPFERLASGDTLLHFEQEQAGQMPSGFTADATGSAKTKQWRIVDDGGNKVVEQQAQNEGSCFNLLALDKIGYGDFSASVKIKAVSGDEDQGGGLVWRYLDKDNYYIARYNPLENNLRLYRVVGGSRSQIKSVDSGIRQGEWFTMGIEMRGNQIACSLDGEKLIEETDNTFKAPGLVGFWTKADARSYFDDLTIKIK
jgi:hypothetical protein